MLIGFAKITRDITERQTAQSALHDSERNFRLLVNGVTDYALYMLDPEGHVSSWNAGGAADQGLCAGRDHRPAFLPLLLRRRPAPPAGRRARCRSRAKPAATRRKAGASARTVSFFWASVVIDPIRDDDGKLVGFAKITRDITERREAQVALEQVQQQLAQSQKMDALGQLTGGVAHDFNNLLMIVTGNIQTLKKVAAQDPKAARAAQAIEIAAQRGAALTRQLLTFSRRQRVNPESIDVRQRIESIREVLTSGLGGNVRLCDRYRHRRVAGHRRCRRIRDRAGQPRRQCARRHAGRRHGRRSRPRT